MSLLIEMNGFEASDNGVYKAQGADPFAYSDGESSEKLLEQILSKTQDLSSNSEELNSQIVDWPSEYHLSVARANLLRPLNLNNVQRVLELGCGCGSITRYLGEQPGIQVDSIEGSPSRAALAALRCKDLDNVTITTANFNKIEIPENYYDLVLFVGVTEYAGRFSAHERDQDALQDLLAIGRRASTPEGVTVVAIENRVGLKYLMGACEDHYGVPYVGLDDYPESSGIRTYTKDEWQTQLNLAGFTNYHFAYPFPDYKVPSLLISDDALADVEQRSELTDSLSRVKSRCYLADFNLGEQEARMWQGHLEAETLGQHSNSFLIFAGDDLNAINNLCGFLVKEYQTPSLKYLIKNSQQVSNTSSLLDELVQHDELEIAHARAHHLESKVDLITGSTGWRFLNVIRRLLGKSTVR